MTGGIGYFSPLAQTDEVVLFNCASGLKYPMPPVKERMAIG